MKHILIDCRFGDSLSGLGRYTRELVTHLVAKNSDIQYSLLLRNSHARWIPDHIAADQRIHADIAHYSFAEQMKLPSIIKKSGADLFFSLHFNVPLSCPIPFVVTIHDLILHRYPNDASILKRLAYKKIMQHAVTYARSIISISDFVKQELQDAYGKKISQKITVIHEGVDKNYRSVDIHEVQRVRQQYHLQKPYFLYIGNVKQHKNVQVLLDAFIASDRNDCDFVLISGGKEWSRFGEFPPNIKIIRDVPDADMPALLSGSLCFVTASLYEGFCLPVAEALACGTPVVATNGSAIREIAEGHAMLVEPDVESFIGAFRNPPSKVEPYRIGSWEQTARKTKEVLLSSIQ